MTLNKEEVRERALEIAARLMAAEGSEGLKARAVAKEAGVSVGTLYNIFGDLDDLQRLVNMRLLGELGRHSEAAMRDMRARGVTGVRERLVGLARAYFDFVRAHATQWQALLAFNNRIPLADQPDWYAARFDLLFEIIEEVLRDTPLDANRTQRDVAARAIWASVHGIVTTGYARRGRMTNEGAEEIWRQIDLLLSVFVRGLEDG